jgi:hypothetical protein
MRVQAGCRVRQPSFGIKVLNSNPSQVRAGAVYFVNIGLGGVVGGVGAAGEMTNVNQVFHPAGRAELANSP